MTKRLFIDAAHPEEIRVAIANDNRLEKFEFEITSKSLIRGNIYLAKIIRVEPSLQAAFVDYGGGRHGFLGFNEIHPSYYQIPINDREEFERHIQNAIDLRDSQNEDGNDEAEDENSTEDYNISKLKHQFYKRYRIQEVIKKRQVMLVQVVKEERGNKGAALTTFISLAGRYCVVMPNTNRPCGISKKINIPSDRKKMKQIVASLNVQPGMCVVIRTAGLNHTKQEIKKDFEYVLKTWNDIRTATLSSQAPCLIHEEAGIIKRTIRDLYGKDIDEVVVDGAESLKLTKAFMKKILPSHVKKVKQYTDKDSTLFGKYGLEDQIQTMYSTRVDLPSGGYLVINPTEALVSIDVNSGKSTKERSVGTTAIKTNLEAAVEVARQCKLRDLGGLIVVDFIDMDDDKDDSLIERTVKEAFSDDRARVQVGHISNFGLMEISRQRLHPNLMETHRVECPHCSGTGSIWSTESLAIQIIRKIEEICIDPDVKEITVSVSQDAALFLLNNKKSCLVDIENKNGCNIQISINPNLSASEFSTEISKAAQNAIEDSELDEEGDETEITFHSVPRPEKRTRSAQSKDKGTKRSASVKPKRNTRPKNPKVTRKARTESSQEVNIQEISEEISAENSTVQIIPIKKAPKAIARSKDEAVKNKPVENSEKQSTVPENLNINLMSDKINLENHYSTMVNKALHVREEIEKNRNDIASVVLKSTEGQEQKLGNIKAKKGWWNKLLKN